MLATSSVYIYDTHLSPAGLDGDCQFTLLINEMQSWWAEWLIWY